MVNIQLAARDTWWIGASDRRLALFENLFPIPNGVSYNNYAIIDDKIAVFDTSDVTVADQYFENLKAVLGDRKPDYLIVLHMEPDHCSQLSRILALYPELTLVGNTKTFAFMNQFFPELSGAKRLIVKEGDTLSTGHHTLHFIMAPMVHWPEVMFAYDDADGALFSADAFGTFGALDGSIFADDYNFEAKFLDDARRYYSNIVGKFGLQVQMVLKKAAALEIKEILPLHGPIWRKDLGYILDKYQKWSTYTPETDDVLVVYGSLYGHTATAAEAFAARLQAKSGKRVAVYDVSKTDVSYLISEVWRCAKVVLFCPTYYNGMYPKMETFINDMAALCVQNRTFALAENGTWAPVAGKLMNEKISTMKNVRILDNTFTFRSALHESDSDNLDAFVDDVIRA